MSKQTKPTLSEAQIEKLETIYPKLCGLSQSLAPVVAQRFLNELNDIQNIITEVFAQRWEYQDAEEERVYEKLNIIGDENNFITSWSITEVSPEDMDKPFSKKAVKSLTYDSYDGLETIKFSGKGEKLTWLQAWKYADQLIKQSGDQDHIFIEEFIENKPGHFQVITGS